MDSAKKAVGSKLDYGFDWSNWLKAGETISASSWVVETGLTKVSETFTSDSTTVWVEGGTEGVDYTMTNQVITTGGRTPKRSIIIYVRER